MASDTRKYHMQHIDPATGKVTRERIIEATNRATARAHASNTTIAVELLNTDHAVRMGGLGIKVEEATETTSIPVKGDPDQLPLISAMVDPAVVDNAPVTE